MATKQSLWIPLSFLIISACFLGFGAQAAAQSNLEKALIGTWRLVSIEKVRETGEVIRPDDWMGKNPTGVIIYDSSGYMSLQIMRDPRPIWKSDALWDVLEGYYAYFGTYEVNEKGGTVTHHVQGSFKPDEVGENYNPWLKISGNRLMLTNAALQRFTFERVEKGK